MQTHREYFRGIGNFLGVEIAFQQKDIKFREITGSRLRVEPLSKNKKVAI